MVMLFLGDSGAITRKHSSMHWQA